MGISADLHAPQLVWYTAPMPAATARAFANIALIKYWGNRNDCLNLPANGSISMNLDGLFTRTALAFDPSLPADVFTLNGQPGGVSATERVTGFLDHVRRRAGLACFARVDSENNFPAGAGIASSASGFAALALAACAASSLEYDEAQLSRLARLGSGSACRSIPGGFVEWSPGESDDESYAFSVASAGHWDLADCVVILSLEHKPVASYLGHRLASTSPLQSARVESAPLRLEQCRRAILECDFEALAEVIELDSTMMHAVMMTSSPPLLYWLPETLAVMQAVRRWRLEGWPVCYTIDAGPNVHVLCPAQSAPETTRRLELLPGVQRVLVAHPGGPACLEAELTD